MYQVEDGNIHKEVQELEFGKSNAQLVDKKIELIACYG